MKIILLAILSSVAAQEPFCPIIDDRTLTQSLDLQTSSSARNVVTNYQLYTHIQGFIRLRDFTFVQLFSWGDPIPELYDFQFSGCWRHVAKDVQFQNVNYLLSISMPALTHIEQGLVFENIDTRNLGSNVAPRLTFIGPNSLGVSLRIESNQYLNSLGSGFPVLTELPGRLYIRNNPALTDFSGLDNLICHGGIYNDDPNTYCQNCPARIINLPKCSETTKAPTSTPARVIDEVVVNPTNGQNLADYQDFYSVNSNIQLTGLQDATFNSHLASILNVGGSVLIQECSALTSMETEFPNLQSIGGNIEIHNNDALTTLGNSFESLAVFGGNLKITDNDNLEDLGKAFRLLKGITGTIEIGNNRRLDSTKFGGLEDMVCHGGIVKCENCPQSLLNKPKCGDYQLTHPTSDSTTSSSISSGAAVGVAVGLSAFILIVAGALQMLL